MLRVMMYSGREEDRGVGLLPRAVTMGYRPISLCSLGPTRAVWRWPGLRFLGKSKRRAEHMLGKPSTTEPVKGVSPRPSLDLAHEGAGMVGVGGYHSCF